MKTIASCGLDCVKDLLPNLAASGIIGAAAVAAGIASGPIALPAAAATACILAYLGISHRGKVADQQRANQTTAALNLLRARTAKSDKKAAGLVTQLNALGFTLTHDLELVQHRLTHIDALAALNGQSDDKILDFLKKHESLTISLATFLERNFDELRAAGLKLQRSADDIKAWLDDLNQQLRRRPPLVIPFTAADPSSLARLHYSARHIELIGREDELNELITFLQSTAPTGRRWRNFCWWLWTAPGGMGKSRLALQLCLTAEIGLNWDTGFLSKEDEAAFTPTAWQEWRPPRPTLIVFDYLAERPDRVARIITTLHARDLRNDLPHPVRFLLLEREESAGRLQAAFPEPGNPLQIAAVENTSFGGHDRACWHRELAPLSDKHALGVMRQAFSNRGEPFPDEQRVLDILCRADHENRRVIPKGNPLYAAVLAEAILTNGLTDVQNKDAEQLLRTILANEARHWREQSIDAKHFNALALATILRRPVTFEKPFETSISKWLPDPHSASERACDALSAYSSRPPGGPLSISPLEPDRLGELFILDRLGGCFPNGELRATSENQHACADATRDLLRAAWITTPNSAAFLSSNAASDFCFHAALGGLIVPPADLPEPAQAIADYIWSEYAKFFPGTLEKWGKWELAGACWRRLLELCRRLVSANNTPEARRDLSVSLNNVASVDLALGEHAKARGLYEESLGIRRALVKELNTPEARRDLSVSLDNVARVDLALGEHAKARGLYEESLGIARALVKELNTPEASFDLGVSHWWLHMCAGQSGDMTAACIHLRECREATQRAIALAGAIPQYAGALEECERAIVRLGCGSR